MMNLQDTLDMLIQTQTDKAGATVTINRKLVPLLCADASDGEDNEDAVARHVMAAIEYYFPADSGEVTCQTDDEDAITVAGIRVEWGDYEEQILDVMGDFDATFKASLKSNLLENADIILAACALFNK